MNLSRCDNGHFYDKDIYDECPHCAEAAKLKIESGVVDSWDSFWIPKKVPAGDMMPTIPEVLSLPKELSDYTLLDRIGSGSVGDVYKIQRKLDYAVKVIEWKRKNSRMLAKHEYDTAKLFGECGNVIKYIDYFEDGNKSFITQEIGITWINYCRSNAVDVEDVIETILRLCDALEFIHSKGYQHYDINPRNIFICDNDIKLGDFSHSFNIEKGSKYKHRLGTLQFMAPEIADKGECSGTEDIYSLGITMYVLLTGGKLPFDFKGRKPAVRHKEDKIATIFLNSDILSVIEKATAYNSIERYQTITEFKDAVIELKNKYSELLSEMIPTKWSTDNGHTVLIGADWVHNSTETFLGTQPILTDNSNDAFVGDYSSVMLDVYQDDECTSAEEPELQTGYMEIPNNLETETKSVKIDEVQFTAVMEKSADRDDYSIIEIAMYTNQFKEEVIDKLSKEFSKEVKEITSNLLYVKEYCKVTVEMSADGIDMDEPIISHRWNGKYLKFSFDFFVPSDYKRKKILFRANIYFDGIIATVLKFTVDVEGDKSDSIAVERKDVVSAFLSYAREDLSAVTYILQAIRKARPEMDIFFDVETLRSGDNWEKRLYDELLKRDRLFLCWSHFAAASEWVNREWNYMMEKKGIDAIEPIPLEDPNSCPAPRELQGLHFNDVEIMIRKAYGST